MLWVSYDFWRVLHASKNVAEGSAALKLAHSEDLRALSEKLKSDKYFFSVVVAVATTRENFSDLTSLSFKLKFRIGLRSKKYPDMCVAKLIKSMGAHSKI